jgi:3-methyladenine DNA glycosylase/8-oxoguanine DNA glycosylase
MIKKMQNQIERIREMELRMERVAKTVEELMTALSHFKALDDDLEVLDQYYGSDEWKQDLAADEAGRLPRDLKRGVLSEDGLWNLLSEACEMNKRTRRGDD